MHFNVACNGLQYCTLSYTNIGTPTLNSILQITESMRIEFIFACVERLPRIFSY